MARLRNRVIPVVRNNRQRYCDDDDAKLIFIRARLMLPEYTDHEITPRISFETLG